MTSIAELEWLLTNGLGGYASGTVGGALRRRYHGYLIAAFPPPLGRLVMLSDLAEALGPDGNPLRHDGADEIESGIENADGPLWRIQVGRRSAGLDARPRRMSASRSECSWCTA